MHQLLRLSLLAIIVGHASAAAHGAPPRSPNLLVTLDVPHDHAPGHVCVLARYDICHEKGCEPTKVSALQLQRLAERQDQFLIVGEASSAPNVKAVIETIHHRLQEITKKCDASNVMCAPAIELRGYGAAKDPNTRITCSEGDGSQNGRVAFLNLRFATDDDHQPAVIEVKLSGTTVTVVFGESLGPSTRTVVQVIGGDYSPEATTQISYNQQLTISLVPRCRRVIAEIPGFPEGKYDVSVMSDAEDPMHRGACCGVLARQALSLELPVTAESEFKTITARLQHSNPSADRDAVIEAKATWSRALPAAPFQLAAHAFSFSWTKPTGCGAEKWKNPAGWKPSTDEWSLDCSRAVLFDGHACKLSQEDEHQCHYACVVTSLGETLNFPTPIRFERLRWQGDSNGQPFESQVYSWPDLLIYSGQNLVSQVAAQDRRIMLQYDHRERWRTTLGVSFDEVRIVSPSGTTSNQLLSSRDVPPRWDAMNVPGTCVGEVTVAIFGSGVFEESREPVIDGVISLKDPQEYRRHTRLDFELRGVYQPQNGVQDGLPAGHLGFVFSYERWPPISLGLFAGVGLAQKEFLAVDRSPMPAAEQVLIWRIPLGGFVEYWGWTQLHLALRGGAQIDSPLNYSDDPKLGVVSWSFPVEVGILYELLRRRMWLSGGIGGDFRVQHPRFETNFLGTPRATIEDRIEPFITLGLRVRLR